jgi:putative aldouronate transport system permease protein
MAGLVVAFKDYNYAGGMFFSPWNGLDNFRFFFISGKAWPVTRNTLLYNAAFIVFNMILEVSFAIIISELYHRKFKRIIQSSLFLPFFMSWVIVSSIFYNVFNYNAGVVNTFIVSLGGERFDIYGHPALWPFLLVFLKAWKNVGYGTVIYLANITSIDPQLYEAAEIDGANIWQRVRFVTLPSLAPTMIILLLLAMGRMFRGDFGMFYQLVGSNGNLFPVADIIDTFIFRALISSADIGMSSASGFYQSAMCLITILIANKLVKIFQPDYSLF